MNSLEPKILAGSDEADVLLFSKGGRDFRFRALAGGQEVPREFFYG